MSIDYVSGLKIGQDPHSPLFVLFSGNCLEFAEKRGGPIEAYNGERSSANSCLNNLVLKKENDPATFVAAFL